MEHLLNWKFIIPDKKGFPSYLYAKSARERWDGDEWGNEWDCGFSIYFCPEDPIFQLYEDDGTGNGNHIGDFKSKNEAKARAEEYDENPYS